MEKNGQFSTATCNNQSAIHERNGPFFHRNPATHFFVQLRPCRRSSAPSTLPAVDLGDPGEVFPVSGSKKPWERPKMLRQRCETISMTYFSDAFLTMEKNVWLDSSDGSVHVSIAEFHGGDEPP